MHVYLVSYDLNTPGQDYDSLRTAIQSYQEYCHALKSQWFICSDFTAVDVCKHLRKHIDKNDFIFVSEVMPEYQAGWLDDDVVEWLHRAFERSLQ